MALNESIQPLESDDAAFDLCAMEKANLLLDGIGTFACIAWRTRILQRHPGINVILAHQYKATADLHGHAAANRELLECDSSLKLGKTGLYAHATDHKIREYAKAKARNMERDFKAHAQRFNLEVALEWLKGELSKAELVFPIKGNNPDCKDAQLSAVARSVCPKWWRRQLRTIARRRLEHFLRSRGQVCRQRSAYVSTFGLSRRAEQKNRNQNTLLGLEAVTHDEMTGEVDECINLGDAAAASISNPENRRTELMVRMRGYEEIAGALELQGEFLTLTCPSKYHPVLHKTGAPNPKYNGSSPRQAQDYLNHVWQLIRSAWDKVGIRAFGFRVAEPHHDGTPHWHILLFFRPEDADQAWSIFRRYALAEDGDEWRAREVRAQRVTIDAERGTATGYLAKYIAKNIDGYQLGESGDLEAETDAEEGARRVDAWAGIWGIRQFQQIGSTSVTVWREFRRIREAFEDSDPEVLEQLRLAADSGNWAEFVELMGGALVTRNGQTVRAWMVEGEKQNNYAEAIKKMQGIVLRGSALMAKKVQTRHKRWTIQPALAAQESGRLPDNRGGHVMPFQSEKHLC